MCKELSITPRGGGLLDQPAHEIALLNEVFEAIDKHEERMREKEAALSKSRQKQKGK